MALNLRLFKPTEKQKKERAKKKKKLYKDLKYLSLGISNRLRAREKTYNPYFNKWIYKSYSVQFFDYDYRKDPDGNPIPMTQREIKEIRKIFPYDCFFYDTKHGRHFISFAILHGIKISRTRALQTCKNLNLICGDPKAQDYWSSRSELVLRVSPKWRVYKKSKIYQIISLKPKFGGVLKKPEKIRVSKAHFEFYKNHMKLPEWVCDLYENCEMIDLKHTMLFYPSRD